MSFSPAAASTFAARVDTFFWALTIFTLVFAFGVTIALFYLGIKYGKNPDKPRRSEHLESLTLEMVWTIVPTIIALFLFAWGAYVYFQYQKMPENTVDISVIGKRWMWKCQHENGVREVNELHVPRGQAIKLVLTSQDVIHSFYVPAFRAKQDVIPGKYSTMWFEPTLVGEYQLFCAEYCGTEHSTMTGHVYVMEPSDYINWLQGGNALTPAQAGEALFTQMGCVTCHAAGAASRGPNLNKVFGTEQELADGTKVLANEDYVRESILNPTAKVVKGFAPVMPSFKNQLTDDDVMHLIAYVKSLADNKQ